MLFVQIIILLIFLYFILFFCCNVQSNKHLDNIVLNKDLETLNKYKHDLKIWESRVCELDNTTNSSYSINKCYENITRLEINIALLKLELGEIK